MLNRGIQRAVSQRSLKGTLAGTRSRHRIGRFKLPAEMTVPTCEALSPASKSAELSPPDVYLTTIGTGSQMPTEKRSVSATALNIGGRIWLFDCGEGTQLQLWKSTISPPRITRIFISHLHGDHFFGLPAVLCSMNTDRKEYDKPPVEIVGPPGLRRLVRSMLSAGATHLRYLYKVHELHPSSSSVNAEIAQQKLEGNVRHPQEILGKNILPGPDGVWNHIPFSNKDVDTFAVHAVGLRHSQKISSTGFILKETDYPGNFEDPDKVLNLIQSDESRKRLPKRYQKHPHEIFNELKRGVAIEGVLSPTDVLGPTKPGRKIVILGDTFDASTAASMSAGATVVVHEATNGALSNLEKSNENETKKVIARTIMHGHSTPEMAGAFAQAVGAASLVLTHISPQYCGLEMKYPNVITDGFAELARREYDGHVVVANDGMNIVIQGEWQSTDIPSATENERLVLPFVCEKDAESLVRNGTVTPKQAALDAIRATDKFVQIAQDAAREAKT